MYPVRSLLPEVTPPPRSTPDETTSNTSVIGSGQVSGPTGEPVDLFEETPDENPGYDARHPQSLQSVVSGVFKSTSGSLLPSSGEPSPNLSDHHINLSESGIVHLAPLNPPNSSTRASSSSGSARHSGYTGSLQVGSTDEDAQSNSQPSASVSNTSSEPIVTARFEHREDKDGHHLLTGRDGVLVNCEDEVCWIHRLYSLVLMHCSPYVPQVQSNLTVSLSPWRKSTTGSLCARSQRFAFVFSFDIANSYSSLEFETCTWIVTKVSIQTRMFLGHISRVPGEPPLGKHPIFIRRRPCPGRR